MREISLYHNTHTKQGFTLLETLVALAIILAALIGPVALVTRSLSDTSFAKNKLIALNLAQEGLEIVRTVRENNVICEAVGAIAWDWRKDSNGSAGLLTDLPQPRKVSAITVDAYTCNSTTIHNPQTNIAGNCSTDFLTINVLGRYGYDAGTPTIFTRCVDILIPTSAEGVIPATDMLDVVSTVTWTEPRRTKSIILQQRLYHWK